MKRKCVGIYIICLLARLYTSFHITESSKAESFRLEVVTEITMNDIDIQLFDRIHEEVEEVVDMHLTRFLEHLAYRESSNQHSIVNNWGYLGKYQFSPRLLRNLGLNVSNEEFLNNPALQDSMVVVLLKHNQLILKNYIHRHDGTYRGGQIVTESGILAAAHLIGPRRTKLYLETGMDSKDGLGTHTSSYLYEFSGYDISL